MKKLVYCICFAYTLLFVFFSCSEKTDKHAVDLLFQARDIVDDNPSTAAALLDSIADPEAMERADYMRYIVTRLQAKYKLDRSAIKDDTLIFEAYRYFDQKDEPYESALAHYYTASVYHEKKISNKELEHFKAAYYYASQVDDSLLMAKSQHSLGNFYFNRQLYDSALVSYNEAFDYYNTDNRSSDLYRLQVLSYSATICYIEKKLNEASSYFDKGLELSEQLDNKMYQGLFIYYKGLVDYLNNDYRKAEEQYQLALSITSDRSVLIRVYLAMVRLYNKTSQLDSATLYVPLLEQSIPEMTYIYTKQETYQALARYYELAGNYPQSLDYTKKLVKINEEIYIDNNIKKIEDAEREHNALLHEKEMESLRMRNYGIIGFFAVLAMAIAISSYLLIRDLRRKKRVKEAQLVLAENNLALANTNNALLEANAAEQKRRIEQQLRHLEYMKTSSSNFITQWTNVEKYTRKKMKEFGTEEEPELYLMTKQIMDDFIKRTNLQTIEFAKETLLERGLREDAVSALLDKELLLYMLYQWGYRRREVAGILGVGPGKDNMNYRKYDLRNKLVDAGMPREEIENILFLEDKEDESNDDN